MKSFEGLPWNLSVTTLTEPRPDYCVLKLPYYLYDLNAVARVRVNGNNEEATAETRGMLVFQLPVEIPSC